MGTAAGEAVPSDLDREGRTTVTGSAIARLIYLRSGRDGSVAIRPERIEIGTERPQEAANVVEGTIEFVNYLGSLVSYRVRAGGGEASFKVLKPLLDELPPFAEGSRVAIWSEAVFARAA